MARFRVSFKRQVNVPRVVAKIVGVIIALYVGNEVINQLGNVLNGTTGPFNRGFTLIGWEVGDNIYTNGTAFCWSGCGQSVTSDCGGGSNVTAVPNCVLSTNGAGVLTVIGVVGIASIVMEFVNFSM